MRILLAIAFVMSVSAGVNGQTCYEFLGGSISCIPVTTISCPTKPCTFSGGGYTCPHTYQAPNYTGSWDRLKVVSSGYGTDGGGTIYCTYYDSCACEPTMSGVECVDPQSPAPATAVYIPNVDINSSCP